MVTFLFDDCIPAISDNLMLKDIIELNGTIGSITLDDNCWVIIYDMKTKSDGFSAKIMLEKGAFTFNLFDNHGSAGITISYYIKAGYTLNYNSYCVGYIHKFTFV